MAEVAELIESITWMRVIHLRHNPPYLNLPSIFENDAPTAANVFFLLRLAFDYIGVRAAVVLESDIEISPDALTYFAWAYDTVVGDASLKNQVFTVNGYFERSVAGSGDPFSFTTGDYGFMVWGWLCPDFSWPMIKRGFTWGGNWDIIMEAMRARAGKVSLSPTISRTRNIGMQGGINFNVADPSLIQKWTSMRVQEEPVSYVGATMRIREHQADF